MCIHGVAVWVVLIPCFREPVVVDSTVFFPPPRPFLLFLLLLFHTGEGGLLAKKDMGRYAGELLMPLIKSIYSNADRYSIYLYDVRR